MLFYFLDMAVVPAVPFVESFLFFIGDERDLAGTIDAGDIGVGVDGIRDEFLRPL